MPDSKNTEFPCPPAAEGPSALAGSGPTSIAVADKKRRTTVNISVSGDDYTWVVEGATRLGVTQAKFLLDFAKEGHRIHEELLRATAEDFEGSFLHSQLLGMEVRNEETLKEMQGQISTLAFSVNVLLAQADAKNKWDIATTPELPEAVRRQTLEGASSRYKSLFDGTLAGVDGNFQAVFVEKIIQAMDDRSAQ